LLDATNYFTKLARLTTPPGAAEANLESSSMMRKVAIAVLIAAALPGLAAAEPPGHPPPHGRAAGPPAGANHPAARVAPVGPHVGGPAGPHGPRLGGPAGPHGGPIVFRGRQINRVHLAPFAYPAGWGYRRWAVGAILPPLFLAPAYYYSDWATLGLDPPQPGFQWVRYGPDLLLVNVTTGAVVDTVPGVFEE
jgi:Nickel/cobalt transporter regulator